MVNGGFTIGGGVTTIDEEVALSVSYARPEGRRALATLFALDAALGRQVRGIAEPMLARLRLAWWRDQLLAESAGPDPLLAAVARDLIPKGVGGEALAEIADGWAALAEVPVDEEALADHARGRGGLFVAAGVVLGCADARLRAAGEGWGLVALARATADVELRLHATEAAHARLDPVRGHWPRALRPLGALALAARRDARRGAPFAPTGAPGRVARMLAHRLTGR